MQGDEALVYRHGSLMSSGRETEIALCALADGHVRGHGLDWGVYGPRLEHLERLRYLKVPWNGHLESFVVVASLERWRRLLSAMH